MSQQSTNPPQIIHPTDRKARRREKVRTIDTRLMPLEREPEDALRTEIDHLVSLDNIRALCGLYETYVAASEALLAIKNQPRTADTEDFIEYERSRLLSKAFLVADRLQDLWPNCFEHDEFCRVLFGCSMRMGNGATASIAVVQAIPKPPVRA